MILSTEQINRYLRHIIIPEISGPGQKKITEARIFLYSSTVDDASSLVYYLAAAGTGYISCFFDDESGYEKLFDNVNDLNGDVKIELAKTISDNDDSLNDEGFKLRIILYNYNEKRGNLNSCIKDQSHFEFIPAIIIAINGWKGYIKTFITAESFNRFDLKLQNLKKENFTGSVEEKNGRILSSCFAGAITAIESIKCCLNLGTTLDKSLYYNLLTMEFKMENDIKSDVYELLKNSGEENIKVDKLINIKELSQSSVLIAGTGGLGSPAAYALACIGVGTIGFVDYDLVEISNLNRQMLHSVSRIGMQKVESAKKFIKALNPDVNVVTYNTEINASNVKQIIHDYDIVVDAVDNFPSRYLLNDACYFGKKPLVDAAVVKFNGLIMTIIPGKSACYRCVFPDMPEAIAGQGCRENGVLGPVPGVMGFLQAAEVVKVLSGVGELICNRIVCYDALNTELSNIKTSKSPKCELCGESPIITTLIEYQNACESRQE